MPTPPKVLWRAGLILLLTLIGIEASLQLAFLHLPAAITQRMPQYQQRHGFQLDTPHGAREYPAGQTVDFEVTQYSGDLYRIGCLSPADAQPLEPYRVRYTRDQHGFRNPEPWPADIDMVIIGDSFTAAESIAQPFWAGLAESMLVLGLPGSGTLEQARLLNAFGLPRHPETIIIAYFGGNDLSDSQAFAAMQQQGLSFADRAHQNKNPLDYAVTLHLLLFLRDALTASQADCHYPQTAASPAPTPIAFYDAMLPLLALDAATLQSSPLYQHTQTALADIAHSRPTPKTQLILMYIPQKAELYWQYLSADAKQTITAALPPNPLLGGAAITPALIDASLAVQRTQLAALAAELNIAFLDLTPEFAAAIAAGKAPYFYDDTHWNQTGHDIAKAALQRQLQAASP